MRVIGVGCIVRFRGPPFFFFRHCSETDNLPWNQGPEPARWELVLISPDEILRLPEEGGQISNPMADD